MSASPASALDAIAFQLAVALDRYALDGDALVRRWPDMALYAAFSQQMDALRMYCNTLPELSIPAVSLLIAHAELVHCLWKSQSSPLFDRAILDAARDEHHRAVGTLRRQCLRLLVDGAAGRAHGQAA